MKRWLKQRLGDHWQWRLRRLSRLRWLTKYGLLRRAGVPIRKHVRYLLLDPEVESFTYRLANVREMLIEIAEVTHVPMTDIERFVSEAHDDPELGDRLARRLRWRFDVKHRPPLGHRLGWYVLVRALRPPVVCETGVYQGLGSLAILRALERNHVEGAAGELLSFDASAHAGSIIDRRLYPSWRPIIGLTRDTLEPALRGRTVGALFHDTRHTEENQRLEFGAALRHAAPRLLLVDGSGGHVPTLAQMCRERNGVYSRVPLLAEGHWYQPVPLAMGLFELRASDADRQ